MNARSLLLVLVVLLALPGCPGSWWHSSSTSSSWSSDPSDPYGSTGSLDVQAGHQTGATGMGEMGAYDTPATRLEGHKDSYSSYVQLDSVGPGWWIMTGFSFNTDIDTLAPGTTYYADSYTYSTVRPGDTSGMQPVSVDVRGCSGPRDGDYTYDDLATQATFTVEDRPGGLRRVNYDCTFVNDAGETQRSTGFFDYASSTTGASGTTSPSASAGGASVDVRGI